MEQSKHSIGLRRFCQTETLKTRDYYFVYSLVFLVVAAAIYSVYWINGKSFIFCDVSGGGDGLTQHYNSFVYYGVYLRSIIKELFTTGKLVIPQWDMSIGYGQDIIATLSYYVIGDPFAVLSVFCPSRYAEYLYDVLILIRLYLAGVAFSLYCRSHGHTSLYTLSGSLIYVFSAFSLYAATLHPYFINPLIYFPLLALGADRILAGKGSLFYTAMIAVCAISNFYFFYMHCLLIVVYVCFRYFSVMRENRLKKLPGYVLRFVGYSMIGACMAMILLLPAVVGVLGSGRVGGETAIPLLYKPIYYLNFAGAFLSGGNGYYTNMGYTAVAFVCVIVLMIKRKDFTKRTMAVGFLLLTLILLIPYGGHVLNGFSYVTNRWIWGYAFLTGYVVTVMMPQVPSLSKREWRILLFAAAAVSFLLLTVSDTQNEKNVAALLGLFVTLTALLWLRYTRREVWLPAVSVVLTAALLLMNSNYIMANAQTGEMRKYTDRGHGYLETVSTSPASALKGIEDAGDGRFDTADFSQGNVKRNSAMLRNLNGTAYYYSTTGNGSLPQFVEDLYLDTPMYQTYNDLDSRSFLEALWGVRYVVVPKNFKTGQPKKGQLPYGCVEKQKETSRYAVYRTEWSLPLAFTCDSYIPQETYQSLSVTQKQQALLQGIALEKTVSLKQTALSFSDRELPVTVKSTNGVIVQEGTFCVQRENASVTLKFDGTQDSELYLIFENLDFKDASTEEILLWAAEEKAEALEVKTEELNRYERNRLKEKYRFRKDVDSTYIKIKSEKTTKTLNLLTKYSGFYCNRHNFLSNLGYTGTKPITEVTLTFPHRGYYTYDDLRVVSQPVDGLADWVAALTQDSVENWQEQVNGFSGTVRLSEEKLICFSLPYDANWSAFVDGKETPLMKADGFLMALLADKGSHTVELRYRNPWISRGAVLSLFGCAAFVGLILGEKRIRNKKGVKKPHENVIGGCSGV